MKYTDTELLDFLQSTLTSTYNGHTQQLLVPVFRGETLREAVTQIILEASPVVGEMVWGTV